MAAQHFNNRYTSFPANKASDLYDRNELFNPADIMFVSFAEDEEQQRRIIDIEGENAKRVLASNWSLIFSDSLRETWFHRGTSFVLSLLGNVRSATAHTVSSIGIKAQENVRHLSDTLALKTEVAALDIKDKSLDAAHNVSLLAKEKVVDASLLVKEKSIDAAHNVSLLAKEKVVDVKDKSIDAAHNVSSLAKEKVIDVKDKSIDAAHNVSSLAKEKVVDIKEKGIETVKEAGSWFSWKTNEYAQWLKDTVSSMTFYKKLGDLTGHTNLAFAALEEETERQSRLSSPNEILAIHNAMRVSALIKELHPALYRPASEPSVAYKTRLLEEAERTRRVNLNKNDKVDIVNAKAVAELVRENSLSKGVASNVVLEKKVVDLPLENAKPFSAAM